ncbi:MAG: hypothetical protein WC406_06010 [Methanoregula sp.]
MDDRTRLETMIRDTGREILDRMEQKDVWMVFIRQGTYRLFSCNVKMRSSYR